MRTAVSSRFSRKRQSIKRSREIDPLFREFRTRRTRYDFFLLSTRGRTAYRRHVRSRTRLLHVVVGQKRRRMITFAASAVARTRADDELFPKTSAAA